MKKCLIIDDDPLICDLLKHFCSKQNWIGSVLSVADGGQALQAFDAEVFDLVFLDYNLPDLKGKDLLKLMPHPIPTIMVTSEEAFGAESYDYDQIIDFLVKPLSYERFLKAVQRFKAIQPAIRQNANIEKLNSAKNLIVKDGNTTVLLPIDEIRYMKSESNYVVFHLKDRKVMSLHRLKKLEKELPSNFLRIQKSFIINLDFLESIKTDLVIVEGIEIPIGAVHKDQLNQRLKTWNQSN